ncbi:MAG: Phosphatidylinositol-4-phosphate 5-kinase [Bogoriella megaspora]|nr:MAG: Phosphatidylinositol-4-phosphate 5-kinase [Bogoriella megaspora]
MESQANDSLSPDADTIAGDKPEVAYSEALIATDQDLHNMQQEFSKRHKPIFEVVQHAKTAVLALFWEESDMEGLTQEVRDLESVLKTSFAADFRTRTIKANDRQHPPESQVSNILHNFYYEFEGQNTLYIVYYAGHGWKDESSEENDWLKLGGSTAQKAMKNPNNVLIWNKAEAQLQGKDADILLIFDCCHAGLLRMQRGCHTFEFLGACEKGETTPPPGYTSFTRALIWALERMAKEHPQGFSTLDLKNKISMYKHFSADSKQHLSLSLREGLNSRRHVFITPKLSASSSVPSPVQADETKIHSTPGEWLDFRLYFNHDQSLADIRKLADGFTDFVLDHKDQGLQEVELENKSCRIPLFAKDRWLWTMNSLRRRAASLWAPLMNPAEIVAASTSVALIPDITTTSQRPSLEVDTAVYQVGASPRLRATSDDPGLVTPARTDGTTSGDDIEEKQGFHDKDSRKRSSEQQGYEDVDLRARHPKTRKTRAC